MRHACLLAARYFVAVDLLRRILAGYFGYSIRFVMNITDVDDTIIKGPRLAHLLNHSLARTSDTVQQR